MLAIVDDCWRLLNNLRTYFNWIHFFLIDLFRFFETYLLGFETNMPFYSAIKTFHGTSPLFGRHLVSSSSFSPRARLFKLRMSGANFSVSSKCLPQRGHFLPCKT